MPERALSPGMEGPRFAEGLNAVAADDPGGLFNIEMQTHPVGGITRWGVDGNYAYAVRTNMGDKPVNFVSWLDAARYVNCLHNGRPVSTLAPGVTETGAYDLAVGNLITLKPH